MEVRRSTGAVYNLNYHLVWCPKYRRNVLIRQAADRLQDLLHEIAAQYIFEILACEAMPDLGFSFVSAPPKYGNLVRFGRHLTTLAPLALSGVR